MRLSLTMRSRRGKAKNRPARSKPRDGDSLGEDVGIGEVVGFFEIFIADPGPGQSDYYSPRYNKIGT